MGFTKLSLPRVDSLPTKRNNNCNSSQCADCLALAVLQGEHMDSQRLFFTPTMLVVSVLLIGIYLYGYIEQISENKRSVSVYSETVDSAH